MSRTTQTLTGGLLLLLVAMVAAIDLLGGWRHHPAAAEPGRVEHPWTQAARPPEDRPAPVEPLPPSYYLLFPYVIPGGAAQE